MLLRLDRYTAKYAEVLLLVCHHHYVHLLYFILYSYRIIVSGSIQLA